MALNTYPNTYLSWCFNGAEVQVNPFQKAHQYELMEFIASYNAAIDAAYMTDVLANWAIVDDYICEERQPIEYAQVCSDRITELLS